MSYFYQLGAAGIAALAVLAGESAVWADITFTDQADFLAQVTPGYYLETFDELPQYEVVVAPLEFSAGGFSYTASSESEFPSSQRFFPAGPLGDTWLSTNDHSNDIVFDFTSGNVTAVGGYFFRTDIAGDVAVAGTVTLTLDNGTMYSADSPSANSFVGFSTTAPILSLTVSIEPVGVFLEDYATANDLIVGAVVPEPSTVSIAVAGALCALWRLRRRARSSNDVRRPPSSYRADPQ
jgi:hypothetical protein